MWRKCSKIFKPSCLTCSPSALLSVTTAQSSKPPSHPCSTALERPHRCFWFSYWRAPSISPKSPALLQSMELPPAEARDDELGTTALLFSRAAAPPPAPTPGETLRAFSWSTTIVPSLSPCYSEPHSGYYNANLIYHCPAYNLSVTPC